MFQQGCKIFNIEFSLIILRHNKLCQFLKTKSY